MEELPAGPGKAFCPSQNQLSQESTRGHRWGGVLRVGCLGSHAQGQLWAKCLCLPHSYVEALTLNVMALEGGAFGKGLELGEVMRMGPL